MATRNVVLSQHQHELVELLVKSGRYQNASEVLREGLRLLEREHAIDGAVPRFTGWEPHAVLGRANCTRPLRCSPIVGPGVAHVPAGRHQCLRNQPQQARVAARGHGTGDARRSCLCGCLYRSRFAGYWRVPLVR